MSIQTINPATGQTIQVYPQMSSEKVDQIIQATKKAQQLWREIDFSDKSKKMLCVANLLEKNKEKLARCISLEMGKPIQLARAEIEKCQWVCQHYAEESIRYLSPQTIETQYKKSYVCYEPLGIIFAIMPWNFPFWQVFRFAAPNLMAGNACILSHAPIVTQCALEIEKLFLEAGFFENLFRTIIVNHDVSKYVMQHDLIAGVTLTGSERAGSAVGSQAGKTLKKVVLELGGSDPYLILADADLEKAADHIVKSRMGNSGQVCIAAKRIIADYSIHDTLLSIIKNKIEKIRMGDPLEESTQMGPLARADLRQTVHQQVVESIKLGAELICGGNIPEGKGFYYPPTILKNVKPGMPAFDDEIFGPVIAMIASKNDEDAIALANQSRFGLSAAIFTSDLEKGEFIARNRIQVGTCCVNSMVSSDPRLPFGGIKSSGHGRELSLEGIREFTNIKTICIA